MSTTFHLTSPAKVNLFLRIVGRRVDGYHLITSIFQTIDLKDEIEVEVEPSSKEERDFIEIECKGFKCPPGRDNIIFKAAERFFSYTKRKGYSFMVPHLKVRLNKRIPPGSGLGGGSSNAATFLLFLKKILDIKISIKELIRIGMEVSADIPFFLYGGTALVQGIGETVTPLEDFPLLYYLLIFPGFSISTKYIYKKFNFKLTPSFFDVIYPHTLSKMNALVFTNDLERVAERYYPALSNIKNLLKREGDMPVLMSGSGSTIIGIFDNEKHRDAILHRIHPEPEWLIIPAKGIFFDHYNNTTGD